MFRRHHALSLLRCYHTISLIRRLRRDITILLTDADAIAAYHYDAASAAAYFRYAYYCC